MDDTAELISVTEPVTSQRPRSPHPEDVTAVRPAPLSNRWNQQVRRQALVIDGSGDFSLDSDGRRRWSTLRTSCQQLLGGAHDALVVDAALASRLDEDEREEYEKALLRQEVTAIPAGTRGGTRAFFDKLAAVGGVTIIQAPGTPKGAKVHPVIARGTIGAWEAITLPGPRRPREACDDRPDAAAKTSDQDARLTGHLGSSGGSLVKQARLTSGLRQAQLASRAQVPARFVALVENNVVDLRVSELRRLLDAAGHDLLLDATADPERIARGQVEAAVDVARSSEPQTPSAPADPATDDQRPGRSRRNRRRRGKGAKAEASPDLQGVPTSPADPGDRQPEHPQPHPILESSGIEEETA